MLISKHSLFNNSKIPQASQHYQIFGQVALVTTIINKKWGLRWMWTDCSCLCVVASLVLVQLLKIFYSPVYIFLNLYNRSLGALLLDSILSTLTKHQLNVEIYAYRRWMKVINVIKCNKTVRPMSIAFAEEIKNLYFSLILYMREYIILHGSMFVSHTFTWNWLLIIIVYKLSGYSQIPFYMVVQTNNTEEMW